MHSTHGKSGFTLLELSVVLVVVGLLVAGVLVGQSLIRNSEIRAMLTEYDSHQKAVKEFQDKFLQLPGDFPTASSVWSGASNGDGNSFIGSSDDTGLISGSPSEWFLAWRHLNLAGLVNGQFTGAAGGGGAMDAIPGTNVPASKVPGAGWTLYYYRQVATNTELWGDSYGHIFSFGGHQSGKITKEPALTPVELQATDQKMDDGQPGTGKIRARRVAIEADCTDVNTTQAAATYNGTYTDIACSAIFITGF